MMRVIRRCQPAERLDQIAIEARRVLRAAEMAPERPG